MWNPPDPTPPEDEKNYPVQNHPNCDRYPCRVCLDDANFLQKYLEHRLDDLRIDVLGHYHKWLTDNNIPAETEHGWPSVETYEPENIESFIQYWLGALYDEEIPY